MFTVIVNTGFPTVHFIDSILLNLAVLKRRPNDLFVVSRKNVLYNDKLTRSQFY